MPIKFSKFISYFFHPINYPISGALLYFLFVPKFIFKPQEYNILIVVFLGTYIFPILLLLILKQFDMIQNLKLSRIEERKFPVLLFISISFIMGNWLFKTSVVDLLSLLFFGYAIALFLVYLFLYFHIKISLHTVAISGLIGFLAYLSFHYEINIIILLSILFAMAGLIGTSRLKLKAHSLKEVLYGFLIGFSSQIILYFFYIM